jgi:hypothetical protein
MIALCLILPAVLFSLLGFLSPLANEWTLGVDLSSELTEAPHGPWRRFIKLTSR